jgi:general secretion pathway protein N
LVLEGGSGPPLSAAAYASPGGFGADRLTATLPVGNAFAPFAPARVTLSDTRFAFSGTQCLRAEGQIRLTLEGAPAGVEMGRALTGTARCDGDAVATTLTGASGMERIALRLSPDGHYGGTITVKPADQAIGINLAAIGFHETQAGFVAKFGGQF